MQIIYPAVIYGRPLGNVVDTAPTKRVAAQDTPRGKPGPLYKTPFPVRFHSVLRAGGIKPAAWTRLQRGDYFSVDFYQKNGNPFHFTPKRRAMRSAGIFQQGALPRHSGTAQDVLSRGVSEADMKPPLKNRRCIAPVRLNRDTPFRCYTESILPEIRPSPEKAFSSSLKISDDFASTAPARAEITIRFPFLSSYFFRMSL